jgi:hypothetical protein
MVLILAKIVFFITPTIFARKPLENVVIVAQEAIEKWRC